MKKLGLLLSLGAASLLFGSASIIKGSTQNVTFDSKPDGAVVKIDGVKTCVTPCTVPIGNSSKNKMVTIEKKGYTTMNRTLNSEFAPVTILSIFWDLSTTDLVTGAAWQYAPNSYFIELQPEAK